MVGKRNRQRVRIPLIRHQSSAITRHGWRNRRLHQLARLFALFYVNECNGDCSPIDYRPSSGMVAFPGVDPTSTGRPEGTRSDESFSMVSPYSSVSNPQQDSPLVMGEGIPVPEQERNSEVCIAFSVGCLTCTTQRSGCLYCGYSRY